MFQFNIANLTIQFDGDCQPVIERLYEFSAEPGMTPDLRISLKTQDIIKIPQGTIIGSDAIKCLKKPKGEKGYYFIFEQNDSVFALADIDDVWKKGTIIYRNNENRIPSENYKSLTEWFVHTLVGLIFRYGLLYHDGFVIHSSTLEHNGKGIIFSAPSGTGKSTHVKLWQKYIGEDVKVLNDDTPAIRLIDGKPIIFGTPWSGSSRIHCNANAPLEAIVLLEQAPENSIKQLNTSEAILKLMPRVFMPYFDEAMMSLAMGIFERMISSVPVYLLKCRPDKEAVELVYQCVV